MRKSEELHELVHSLTRSEKRFFKIYCSRHEIGGKNNYVMFFDLIDSIKPYSEEKYEKKVSQADFIKHLAAEQNYLYQMIIECLDIYHKESSVDKQITKLTNIARVLANKKLEEQSIKILNKARELAESHHRFALKIPIYELAKRKHFSQDTITPELLAEHYSNLDNTLNRLQRSRNYQKVFDELMLLRRKVGYVMNERVLQEVENIFPNANQPDPISFSSFDEEVFFLLSKMEYFRLVHRGDAGNYYTTRLIKLFEDNAKSLTGIYIDQYIYALNVFIVSHLYKDKEEARTALHKVQHLEEIIGKRANNTYVQAKRFEVYYTCITDLALKEKQYDDIITEMPDIEKRFKEVGKHMTPSFSLVLQANIASIFFNAGQYKTSLKWCHRVINEAPRLREDVYYMMRILYLMIHFELNNEIILPSLILATSRYLGKKNKMDQFERVFIDHFKAQLKANSKKERKELFQSLREKIDLIKDNPYESLALQDIDVFGWIDKRLAKLQ